MSYIHIDLYPLRCSRPRCRLHMNNYNLLSLGEAWPVLTVAQQAHASDHCLSQIMASTYQPCASGPCLSLGTTYMKTFRNVSVLHVISQQAMLQITV